MILDKLFKKNKIKLKNLKAKYRQKYQTLSLEEKVETAKKVITRAFKKYSSENCAVAWTGGKDSTLLLWLVKQVCEEKEYPLPKVMFVDEGDVFQEIWEFVEERKKDWNLNFSVAHNKDVSSQAENIGETIKVANLNERNKKEIKRIGYQENQFPYQPESFVGNHLMKTVATNIWLEENDMQALFTGVRWDEQEARSEDDFIRKMDKPEHLRVEPILHFSEKEVWDTTHKHNIPYVKLYEQGYRSLGAKTTTDKPADKPAWEQDLEETSERAGRRQDKEKIMKRLRELGYM